MGAQQFWTRGDGKTASEAFQAARAEALHEYGHGGYTGTIAEKDSFQEFTLPAGVTVKQVAAWLEKMDDARYDGDEGNLLDIPVQHLSLVKRIWEAQDDRWGPAACLKVQDGQWVFFGWASS